MDFLITLNKRELYDLISLVVDECSRHYYWSSKGNASNYSYHMNVVAHLEPLRDKLKRVANLE